MVKSSKLIEYDRYNSKAEKEFERLSSATIHQRLGAQSLPEYFRTPYIEYEHVIREYAGSGKILLDVCCGDGMYSLIGVVQGAEVHVSDISEKSVKLVLTKAKLLGYDIQGEVADAEDLPYPDHFFDIITCAGSLSYVDLNIFLTQIDRVLRPGGIFICVDSFNHNPIYRLNRFIHYLRGNRTWSVNQRIPNLSTVNDIKKKFKSVEVRYFGIFSFLIPLLSLFWGRKKVQIMLDKLDVQFYFFKKYSFKILIIATKLR